MLLNTVRRCCSTTASSSAFCGPSVGLFCAPGNQPDPETKAYEKDSHSERQKDEMNKSSNSNNFLELPEESSESVKDSEKQKSTGTDSRREFYMREDEIKLAKSMGIGIDDEKIGAYLMDALLSKSPNGTTLSGMKIAMFDLHSRHFAERLVNASVSSLSIVETSQYEAQKAKEYAGRIRRKRDLLLGAYRANMELLFPVCTRKKQPPFPAKLLFANQQLMKDSVNPLSLKRNGCESGDESGDSQKFAPVIIGILPTVNQQSNMFTSLVYNLIMHLCALKKDTMFQYGAVQFITFLSASNFALALCAVDPNMQFVSNSNKHKSWLLNKLFTVKPISGYSGFSRKLFTPHFPLPKSFPYEKKFNSIGIRNENLYAVSIEPRRSDYISNLSDNSEVVDQMEMSRPAEILIKYAFWIIFTSKMTARTRIVQKLREWFPKASADFASLMGSDVKVADLNLSDFDEIFSVIHEDMNDDFKHITELRNFCAQFKPTNMDTRFAD